MSEELNENVVVDEKVVDNEVAESSVEEGEQEELMQIHIGGESFLVRVKEIGEILRPRPLTPVPMAPDHMLGVANVHGQIVCVIEPSKVMRLEKGMKPDTEMTRYLLLRHPRMHVAIRVDEASKLFRIRADLLPEAEAAEGFVRGELEIEQETYRLLHVAALFD